MMDQMFAESIKQWALNIVHYKVVWVKFENERGAFLFEEWPFQFQSVAMS